MKDRKGHTQLGGGWTQDEDGAIWDDQGYRWYGHQGGQENTLVQTNKDQEAIISDPGVGAERIIHFEEFRHPSLPLPKPEDVWEFHKKSILDKIFKFGLTTDDNVPPQFHQAGYSTHIILVCKFTNRVSEYDGMKAGQGGVHFKGGSKVTAHKVNNVNELLKLGGRDSGKML